MSPLRVLLGQLHYEQATQAQQPEGQGRVLLSIPLKRVNDMPTAELAGKVVIDTSSCMIWRDGHYPQIDSGEKTAHRLRQEQLPESKGGAGFHPYPGALEKSLWQKQ